MRRFGERVEHHGERSASELDGGIKSNYLTVQFITAFMCSLKYGETCVRSLFFSRLRKKVNNLDSVGEVLVERLSDAFMTRHNMLCHTAEILCGSSNILISGLTAF